MSFKKKKVEAALGNLFSTAKKSVEEAKPAGKKPRPKPVAPETPPAPAETTAESIPLEPSSPEKTSETPQATPEIPAPPSTPAPSPQETAVNIAPTQQVSPQPAVKSNAGDSSVQETPVAAVQPRQQSVSSEEKAAGKEEIRQLVIFTLADEAFGLPIERVESIIQTQAITVVPNAKPYVVGVTNLRGTVLPVIDLRRRFNLAAAQDTNEQRIVVVLYNDEKIGLRVDAVSQVLRLPAEAIEPPPALVTAGVHSGYITGVAKVEDQLVILLDLEKVLAAESQG